MRGTYFLLFSTCDCMLATRWDFIVSGQGSQWRPGTGVRIYKVKCEPLLQPLLVSPKRATPSPWHHQPTNLGPLAVFRSQAIGGVRSGRPPCSPETTLLRHQTMNLTDLFSPLLSCCIEATLYPRMAKQQTPSRLLWLPCKLGPTSAIRVIKY